MHRACIGMSGLMQVLPCAGVCAAANLWPAFLKTLRNRLDEVPDPMCSMHPISVKTMRAGSLF